MLVTHTINSSGQRRIYLGGKASIECWLEPAADTTGWTFHLHEAPDASPISEADKKEWAQHVLLQLADELHVEPSALGAVPFDTIAAMHVNRPQDFRRVPLPRKTPAERGYMAAAPDETRPRSDFAHENFSHWRQRTGQ